MYVTADTAVKESHLWDERKNTLRQNQCSNCDVEIFDTLNKIPLCMAKSIWFLTVFWRSILNLIYIIKYVLLYGLKEIMSHIFKY